MDFVIRCPNCGTENSAFVRFMKLSHCRECDYDLELIEVSELLCRGGRLQGQSNLYEYEVSRKGASFLPRGVLRAAPVSLDRERRVLQFSGDLDTAPGVRLLWGRLKQGQKEVSFDRVDRIEVLYQMERLPGGDHPYQHHWDVALVLEDERRVPLGRITAERKFPGPVSSHHYALRLAHALHELTGWPVQRRGGSGESGQGSSPEK